MDQKEQQLALMERFRMAYARQDRDELLATTTSDFIWQQHDADTVDDLPAGRVLQGVDALLLRASSELDGVEVDLAAVTGTAASGVEGGEALTAFVDAVMTRDELCHHRCSRKGRGSAGCAGAHRCSRSTR